MAAPAPASISEGESDLAGDEDVVGSAPAHAADGFARIGLHDLVDFRARELPGGREAEEDSGADRDHDAEDQDRAG